MKVTHGGPGIVHAGKRNDQPISAMRFPRPSIFGLVLFSACASVPITGRKQFTLVPESQLHAMSVTEYQSFLAGNKPLPATDERTVMVKRIGERLAAATTQYLKENNAADRVEGFEWEFNVVQDEQVNAWCMPGGKVVVYTGILPVTQDETSLAVVMGHEIAHAIARHGNERMSQGIAAQGVNMSLDLLTREKPGTARDLFLTSFGVGSQLGLLAYSRQQESEADKLGLVFMALAGYDPHVAPAFWQRMAQQSKGGAPPELLSTHPSDERRIRDIEAYLPKAMKYYHPAGSQNKAQPLGQR
jgi:predicted Zn-dependent protease